MARCCSYSALFLAGTDLVSPSQVASVSVSCVKHEFDRKQSNRMLKGCAAQGSPPCPWQGKIHQVRSLQQGSRAQMQARRPVDHLRVGAAIDPALSSSSQQQPEADTCRSRKLAKMLRAIGVGMTVAVPILFLRPAPAQAQHTYSASAAAAPTTTDRSQSSHGASCSGRCSAEAEGGGLSSSGRASSSSMQRRVPNIIADLAQPDDGTGAPYAGSLPSRPAHAATGAAAAPPGQASEAGPVTDAWGILAAADQVAAHVYDQARASLVNVTPMRSMQSISTLDAQCPPVGHASGIIWDSRGTVVTSYRLVRGAAEMKVRACMHVSEQARGQSAPHAPP